MSNQIIFETQQDVPADYRTHLPPPIILKDKLEELPKKISLELTPARVKVRYINEAQNIEIAKTITYQTLAKILAEDLLQDTGFLYLTGDKYQGIRRIYSKGTKKLILIESKSQSRTVLFKNKTLRDAQLLEYQNIPFPYLLMMIKTSGENGNVHLDQTRIYAMKSPLVREDQLLYDYPYSNVYNDDNRVCWGGVPQKHKNLFEATTAINTFFNTIMNNDLYSPLRSPLPHSTFQEVLAQISINPEAWTSYPYETLRNPKRFDNIIENMKL